MRSGCFGVAITTSLVMNRLRRCVAETADHHRARRIAQVWKPVRHEGRLVRASRDVRPTEMRATIRGPFHPGGPDDLPRHNGCGSLRAKIMNSRTAMSGQSSDSPDLPLRDAISRFISGDNEALGWLYRQYGNEMARRARRHLARRGVRPSALDVDDVVNLALYSLWVARDRGALATINTSKDLWRMFSGTLRNLVRDVRDRLDATKRGGSGARTNGRGGRHRAASASAQLRGALQVQPDVNLDELTSPSSPNQEAVLADLESEEFASQMDSDLRQIFTMRIEGCSTDEIASRLQLAEATVRRKQAKIRASYDAYAGRGRSERLGTAKFAGTHPRDESR